MLRRVLRRFRRRPVVHLLHIGKTGGTALRHALAEEAASDGAVDLRLCPHETTLPDIPPGELVVFFLRDPVTRFVSGFLSRQRMGRPRYHAPHSPSEQAAFVAFSSPNALARAIGSDDAVLRAQAHAAMDGIAHVRDRYTRWLVSPAYLQSRARDVLFIGWQETLSNDARILQRKLALPRPLILPDGEVEAHRNPEPERGVLDEAAARQLRAWLVDDYEMVAACRALLTGHPHLADPAVTALDR